MTLLGVVIFLALSLAGAIALAIHTRRRDADVTIPEFRPAETSKAPGRVKSHQIKWEINE